MTKSEIILELYLKNPKLTCSEIADEVGCSNRYVRRITNPLRETKNNVVKAKSKLPAKILILDIETSPMEAYVWRLWKQSVNPGQIMKDWSILSWSAKWLMEPETFGAAVSPKEANERTDNSMMQDLWDLLEVADIVVAHNGNRFDIPRINTRLLVNGYKPYRSPRFIDTLSVVKRTFDFSSNKLDLVNESLGILQKLEHEGMGMWKKAVNGTHDESQAALDNMLEYNKVDVLALEELYLVLRPWIKSHPNVNLFMDVLGDDHEISCAHCGSSSITWGGHYYTPAGRYESFRCEDCGAIGRSRYADLTLDERKTLGIAVAS